MAWADAALAQACPPQGATVPNRMVTMSASVGIPVYSSELSRERINAIASGKGVGNGSSVVGLTVSEVEGAVIPQLWSVDLGGGRRCVGVGRVEGSWRLRDLIVYIASEYAPGACNYAKIRQHEDEHVAINRETFQRWTPRLEAALREAAGRERPNVTSADMEQVKHDLTERLRKALGPTIDAYKAELKTRNAAIDTTANYRLVMSRCPKW